MRHWIVGVIALIAGFGWASGAAAQAHDERIDVLNHVSCYPFGLDRIGASDVPAGIEVWKGCFADDFAFSVFIGFGEPTVCPGEKCNVTGANSIDKRAALARSIYERAGYVRTSHHLANQTVMMDGADKAHVKSYLAAYHVKSDGSIVEGVGSWEVDLQKGANGWRITKENLNMIGAAGLQSLRR